MPLSRALALSLAVVTLTTQVTRAQEADETVGDPERGKRVFSSVGDCVRCHGWPGDGVTGVHLRAPPGANLRETVMDEAGLIDVIRCGVPGTPMPYHARSAYREGDDTCFGMVMSDFEPGTEPYRGKTFSDKDVVNLVAYLQAHVIGRGKPTFEECAEFYDNPAAQACRTLK